MNLFKKASSKVFILFFVFIIFISLFIFSFTTIINAEDGYCTVDYAVMTSDPQESENCGSRHTEFYCESDPYFHVYKATWCKWINSNDPPPPDLDVPTVINPTKTSIAPTSAILGATVSSLGIPALLFDRGTCITTNSGEIPVQSNCIQEGATTLGVFSHVRNV